MLLSEKMTAWIEGETKDMTTVQIAQELSAMSLILIGSMAKIAAKDDRQIEYIDSMLRSIEELKAMVR